MSNAMKTLLNLQNGARAGGMEVIDYTYYDTAKFSDGPEIRMFTAALGQNGKTKAETNMKTPGAIPQGQRMTVAKIKAMLYSSGTISEGTLAKLYEAIFKTTVDIELPGKTNMGQFTLAEVLGTSFLAVVKPSQAGDNVNVISPRFHGILPLNTPLSLPALQPFELVVRPNCEIDQYVGHVQLRIGLNGILESAF